jgi:hypothetical protein
VRLEPLYRVRFTTPEAWSVEVAAGAGSLSFLIAEGRCEGVVDGRYRGANFPRRRPDGTTAPDFRGVLETDDGATILFAWSGLGRRAQGGGLELVGSMTHVSDDERYRWLNDRVCAVAGAVQPHPDDRGFDVVLEIADLAWEPPTA